MKKFFNDMLQQLWTLLGMFIAWFVLDGSARDVVGWAILFSTITWVGTYKLRNPSEDED